MKYNKSVRIWLLIGVVMLFVQVILGGITRITGSGLSITRWDIITGTLPPLSMGAWNIVFDLYKETPQYNQINGGMSLSDFKFIFFWEYVHRLWARLMGIVFLGPFIYFLLKSKLSKRLIYRLVIVFFLSALTASFGWIMVASGLLERPWVNAYKLGVHLLLAFITYAYLLWTYLLTSFPKNHIIIERGLYIILRIFVIFLWLQIFLGGIVSGMRAGLFYNSWPSMSDSFIPAVLLDWKEWTWVNMTRYDEYLFAPSLVQFVHRNIAYLLLVLSFIFVYKHKLSRINVRMNRTKYLFITIILVQACLGISILLLAKGDIPLLYGVLHQAVAFLLLGISLFMIYSFKIKNNYD